MQNRSNNFDSFFKQNVSKMNTEAASMGCGSSMTDKDLSIIEDQMYKEALLYKKCATYADYFADSNLKSMASSAAEHHKQHFHKLHEHLNTTM